MRSAAQSSHGSEHSLVRIRNEVVSTTPRSDAKDHGSMRQEQNARLDGLNQDRLVEILRRTTIALVRREGADLTIRQMSVFLCCYLDEKTDHTVRGLAALLHVHKPAISRALDRLAALNFLQRKTDPADRRSIVVRQTGEGMSFFRDLTGIVDRAAQETRAATVGTPTSQDTTAPALEPA
jgi:DNA-binding MarR family transcriptional regulator